MTKHKAAIEALIVGRQRLVQDLEDWQSQVAEAERALISLERSQARTEREIAEYDEALALLKRRTAR